MQGCFGVGMAVAILYLLGCAALPFDPKPTLGLPQPIRRLLIGRVERYSTFKGGASRLVVADADGSSSGADQTADFFGGIKARV